MKPSKMFGLSLSKSDYKLLNWITPFIIVLLGGASISAFSKGDFPSAFQSAGFFLLFFFTLLGPLMWKLVTPEQNRTLDTIRVLGQIFGIFVAVSGLVARVFN